MYEISFDRVIKFLGTHRLLKHASMQVNWGDKIGIVGENGTGKSTILQLMSGKMKLRHCAGYPYAPIPPGYDEGWVKISKGLKCAYLEQIHDYNETYTVRDVLNDSFSKLDQIEAQMRQIEKEMALAEGKKLDKYMNQYTALTTQFECQGGYEREEKLSKICSGLGFEESFLKTPFKCLSGGEQTTVVLGKILLSDANCLLLDEPTNHLDMAAIEWLQTYLKEFKGIVAVVSHDREFLDSITTKIIEIEDKKCVTYHGNYTYYKAQKKVSDAPKKCLPIKSQRRSGDRVFTISELSKAYGDRCLFNRIDLLVRYGERIAILGPNGCGKSTFIKILLGIEAPDSGEVKMGQSVNLAYLPQNDPFEDASQTVLDYMRENLTISEVDARSHLAKFLFPGGNVFKKISLLSGGERVRLKLCKLLYTDINLLILDEPTNHLDIVSIERIEAALEQYKGTLILISHDRYFVNTVANKKIWIEGGRFVHE